MQDQGFESLRARSFINDATFGSSRLKNRRTRSDVGVQCSRAHSTMHAPSPTEPTSTPITAKPATIPSIYIAYPYLRRRVETLVTPGRVTPVPIYRHDTQLDLP